MSYSVTVDQEIGANQPKPRRGRTSKWRRTMEIKFAVIIDGMIMGIGNTGKAAQESAIKWAGRNENEDERNETIRNLDVSTFIRDNDQWELVKVCGEYVDGSNTFDLTPDRDAIIPNK